jgi:hypothetical protein
MTMISRQSKWRNWVSNTRIIQDCANMKPTKPSKPGSEGFVGSTPRKIPIVQGQPRVPDPAAGEKENSIPWADWKSAAINRLFEEQGLTRRPGKLTGAIVRHGEQASRKVDCESTSKRRMLSGGWPE